MSTGKKLKRRRKAKEYIPAEEESPPPNVEKLDFDDIKSLKMFGVHPGNTQTSSLYADIDMDQDVDLDLTSPEPTNKRAVKMPLTNKPSKIQQRISPEDKNDDSVLQHMSFDDEEEDDDIYIQQRKKKKRISSTDDDQIYQLKHILFIFEFIRDVFFKTKIDHLQKDNA